MGVRHAERLSTVSGWSGRGVILIRMMCVPRQLSAFSGAELWPRPHLGVTAPLQSALFSEIPFRITSHISLSHISLQLIPRCPYLYTVMYRRQMAPDTGLLDSYGAEAALGTVTHFYFSPNSVSSRILSCLVSRKNKRLNVSIKPKQFQK